MIRKSLIISVFIIIVSQPSFGAINELETAIIQQDYQKAKLLATNLLGSELEDNEVDEVRFYLGLSHLRLREYERARSIFQDLVEQPVEQQLRDRSYLGLFNSYYLNEDYREASKIINDLYKLSPKSSFLSLIYLKMARVNLKLTNWRKARDYLKKIINDHPNSMEVATAKQLLEERQYFAVQVGAFLDRKLAEDQVAELRLKKEYAYIVETKDKSNRKFYRVRVGQMTLLDDARQLKRRLSKQGYPTQIYP